MIRVVQGRVGSGKSYSVARESIRHLCNGGVVATNMAIDLPAVRRKYHRRIGSWQLIRIDATFDPRTIPRGDLRGHGKRRVLVVLDEALNWFASETSGASRNDGRKALWGEWLRQSDKLGQDVVFIAQSFERAAKWVRELAQVAVDVFNFGQVTLLGLPIGKWCHLDHLAMEVTWDVRSKSRLGVRLVHQGPEVWDCYESAELFGFQAASSAYVASAWPAYRVPGVRLMWLPIGWSLVRVAVEVLR